MKRQTDEEKAKFEVEMSVLNENLTTIRGDLVSNLAAMEEANKLNDQLLGEKLGDYLLIIFTQSFNGFKSNRSYGVYQVIVSIVFC